MNDEMLEKLKAIKTDLIRELAYINGKHDALTNEIAMLNHLLASCDGFEEEEDA